MCVSHYGTDHYIIYYPICHRTFLIYAKRNYTLTEWKKAIPFWFRFSTSFVPHSFATTINIKRLWLITCVCMMSCWFSTPITSNILCHSPIAFNFSLKQMNYLLNFCWTPSEAFHYGTHSISPFYIQFFFVLIFYWALVRQEKGFSYNSKE